MKNVRIFSREAVQVSPGSSLPLLPIGQEESRRREDGLPLSRHGQHYQAFPGIYAAGELADMAGGHIDGKNGLEGTMVGPSLFSGRVAGAWAAN